MVAFDEISTFVMLRLWFIAWTCDYLVTRLVRNGSSLQCKPEELSQNSEQLRIR
jgi:hypothetical protein